MKQGNLIFNIIIGIAVVVLYILHFSSPTASPVFTSTSDSTHVVDESATTVYVNGDSLLENYDYFKKAKKDFEAKTARTENEIAGKRSILEKDFANYQQQGSSMTTEQRAKIEEALMRKEQELRAYSESAATKLQEEQVKFNEKLFDKVSDYLKEHTKGKKYKIVMNYTKGTGILYANDSLDITNEVLKGLNEQYQKEN
jgi:outer membrane protein